VIPRADFIHSASPHTFIASGIDGGCCHVQRMTTSSPDGLHDRRPGSIIAALPAVLGFVPENSLVLTTLEDGVLGTVMRVDLSDALVHSVDEMADLAANTDCDGAIAVIVDGDGATCRMCDDAHRRLADALALALDERGIELTDAYVVDRVCAGGRWHCADGCGRSGTVEDPSASPMAAAAVLDGRRLYSTRDELLEVVSVTDPARAQALLGVISEMAESRGTERGDADTRGDIEHAIATAAALARGQWPSDASVARVACAMTDPRVRDMLYALAVGCDAAQAESLWMLLARTLPDPWRADALVLMAFSAYARGDGPLAGIALEAALRVAADHRMAQMLDQALRTGMRPDQIRELGRSGYRLATQLGVTMPPRTLSGGRGR
jgi:hypothetical protein